MQLHLNSTELTCKRLVEVTQAYIDHTCNEIFLNLNELKLIEQLILDSDFRLDIYSSDIRLI